MDLGIKSTGFLIDEFITTTFKYEVTKKEEYLLRLALLAELILKRCPTFFEDKQLQFFVDALRNTSRCCWDAQEEVMNLDDHDSNCGLAAKEAQYWNNRRNINIREIDKYLGEIDISPLEKTYG